MSIRNEILFPKKPYKKRPKQNFGVLDIETDGLGGAYIYGATYYPEDGIKFHDTMLDLVKYIAKHLGTEWYAHNGAKYDYLYLLENGSESKKFLIENFNISILSTKASTIGLVLHPSKFDEPNKRVRKYDIKLKDFYRIVPFGLQKVTDKFCTKYKKLGGTIDFEKEKFDKTNKTHIQYLINDVLSLYEAISVFADIVFDTFKIKLGWTTPGMAMDAWQRTMTKSFKRLPEDIRKFIRNTYHGGMVQVRYTHKPDIFHGVKGKDLSIKAYDVKSEIVGLLLSVSSGVTNFTIMSGSVVSVRILLLVSLLFTFLAILSIGFVLYPRHNMGKKVNLGSYMPKNTYFPLVCKSNVSNHSKLVMETDWVSELSYESMKLSLIRDTKLFWFCWVVRLSGISLGCIFCAVYIVNSHTS
jgi:hypothetical protein